ncbi:hypothetical protein ACWEOO_24370 [Kribbella sp. NPDC004138]
MRIARITLGLLLSLSGLMAAVAGAVAAFWLVGPDNTISTPGRELTSRGLAVVTAPALLDRHGPTLHVSASGDKPLFVGVGRDLDVRDYLSGAAHTQLVRFDPPGMFGTQELRGASAKLTPPGELDWWVAQSVAGSQSVSWPIQDGLYDVVVMNADGTPAVGGQVTFGIEVHRLFGICLLVLGAGVLVLALGLTLMLRRRRVVVADTTELPVIKNDRIPVLVSTAPVARENTPAYRVSPFAPDRVSPFAPTPTPAEPAAVKAAIKSASQTAAAATAAQATAAAVTAATEAGPAGAATAGTATAAAARAAAARAVAATAGAASAEPASASPATAAAAVGTAAAGCATAGSAAATGATSSAASAAAASASPATAAAAGTAMAGAATIGAATAGAAATRGAATIGAAPAAAGTAGSATAPAGTAAAATAGAGPAAVAAGSVAGVGLGRGAGGAGRAVPVRGARVRPAVPVAPVFMSAAAVARAKAPVLIGAGAAQRHEAPAQPPHEEPAEDVAPETVPLAVSPEFVKSDEAVRRTAALLASGALLLTATSCSLVPPKNTLTAADSRPAVTLADAQAVVQRYSQLNNQANRTRDAKLAATIEGNPTLAQTQAGFLIGRKLDAAGKEVSKPFSYTDPEVGAPQFTSYPMRFVVSSGVSNAPGNRQLGVWQRQSAGSPWLLTHSVYPPKAVELPAVDGMRTPQAADLEQLQRQPETVAKDLAAYLSGGKNAPQSKLFTPSPALTQTLDLRGKSKAADTAEPYIASVTDTFAPSGKPLTFITASGDALVFLSLTEQYLQRVEPGSNAYWTSGEATAFSSMVKYTQTLHQDYLHQVALVIPVKSSGDAVQVLSIDPQLVGAGGA